MDKLNELLKELGISKVNLAKFLGVSRQMIYNYLELDDINKWPKDKKVLLFNLLGIKSADEIENIKVDTDYILNVETRINNLFENNNTVIDSSNLFSGLNSKKKELMTNICSLIKEDLDDDDEKGHNLTTYEYLYNFLQTMSSSKELKYILAYMAKAAGFIKPLEFVYDEEDQFLFESVIYSAMTLYNNPSRISRTKIAETHKRFVDQIEHKREERLGRTRELNNMKMQALKELNYTDITKENASEVLARMAEIESRKVS